MVQWHALLQTVCGFSLLRMCMNLFWDPSSSCCLQPKLGINTRMFSNTTRMHRASFDLAVAFSIATHQLKY
jgi:hypothetical protein